MAAKHIAKAGGLTGAPSSVNIDVYDEDTPGALLVNIPNADISQVGTTDVYQVDLRNTSVTATLALPKDGEHKERAYTLVWKDDAANAKFATELVNGVASLRSVDRLFRRETAIYPTTTIPSRGITEAVRGAGKASHLVVDLSPDPDDFSTPAFTYYEILVYDGLGRASTRTPSTTPPNP